MKHVNGFGVDFSGSEGRVRVNRGKFIFEREGKVIASCRGEPDEETSVAQQVKIAQEFLKDSKVNLYVSKSHVGDFLNCVKSRQQPITNAQVRGRSAICCHLLNLAYRHHQEIGWNPEQLSFATGGGDLKWLTREYRGPWKV